MQTTMQGSKKQRAFKAWTNQARRKTGSKGESQRMCACNLYPCINSKTATHALAAKAKSLLLKNRERKNLSHLERGLHVNARHINAKFSLKRCVAGMFQITWRVLLAVCICTLLTGTHEMHMRQIKCKEVCAREYKKKFFFQNNGAKQLILMHNASQYKRRIEYRPQCINCADGVHDLVGDFSFNANKDLINLLVSKTNKITAEENDFTERHIMQTNYAGANRFNERYKLWREDKTTEDSIIFDSLNAEEQIRILQDVKLCDDVLSTDGSGDNKLNDDDKHDPTSKNIKDNGTQATRPRRRR